jgi:hypothetical protein
MRNPIRTPILAGLVDLAVAAMLTPPVTLPCRHKPHPKSFAKTTRTTRTPRPCSGDFDSGITSSLGNTDWYPRHSSQQRKSG